MSMYLSVIFILWGHSGLSTASFLTAEVMLGPFDGLHIFDIHFEPFEDEVMRK